VYIDAKSGFVYLKDRYYDPGLRPAGVAEAPAAKSGSPYGYGYDGPRNLTDRSDARG
jgi:hypothetical protein